MAGGKLTARQKMINLMYLVFIAMMAMNVDREVLRSFEGVNQSLQLSTTLSSENNKTFYDQIEAKKEEDKAYVPISEMAIELKTEADKTYEVIQSLKNEIIGLTGYKETGAGEDTNYNSLQNVDATNKIMFASEKKPTDKALAMLNQLKAFKEFLLKDPKDSTKTATVAEATKNRINKIFDFSEKDKNTSWLADQFYGQPMIATLTNLTKLQSSIRTEEGYRVRDLLANKLDEEIELKAFVPIVASPKFVRAGEKFDVIVGFGAYDNTLKGSITLNGRNVPLSGGRGVVSMVASGSGKQTLSGSITYETGAGAKTEKFNETYEVVAETLKDIPTGGSVVADKMNVVYRGVDNPMSGSVTGVDAATISMSTSNGTLTKSGKGWTYRAGTGNSTSFTISGKTSQGKVVSTTAQFRIKNVPKAQGQIRGVNVLSMPASSLPNQVISAGIPDFEFPVTFNVTGFKVKVSGAGTTAVSGNSLRSAAGYLARAKAGDQVLIFDISATATGITQQNISPIVINVQ